MVANFIKSALRFLKHNKVFALINLTSLSIALAVSFIILLYVINELSYNHFDKKRHRVYRVLSNYVEYNLTFAETPFVLAEVMKDQFPQVEKAIRVKQISGFSIMLNNDLINIENAIATDSEIFDIFTLHLTQGQNNNDLLDDNNSIVLSQNLAEKLFPGHDPTGQKVAVFINNKENIFTVTGVFKDIPENSTLKSDCFINSSWTIEPINRTFKINDADQSWVYPNWQTWVLLSRDYNPEVFENQFRSIEVKYMGEKPRYHYYLQRLDNVYLGSDNIIKAGITGNKNNLRLFSAVAVVILIVAALNYIILSTAISTGRGREIAIRKTFGANKRILKIQLLNESIILTMIVFPVALILMKISLPFAEKLFETQINIFRSNILTYVFVYLSLILIIGIISGQYTSSFLSKLKVMEILRANYLYGKSKQLLRSLLIIIQLVIFSVLVSSTLIIHSQYRYALNRNPNFFQHDVIMIDLGGEFKDYSTFLNNIKSNPNVIMASGSLWSLPTSNRSIDRVPNFQNKDNIVQVERMKVDYNFLQTLGVPLAEGREFSKDFGSDIDQSVILNETAVKTLGITNPLGKVIGGSTIIGVVKDFNIHSIHSDIPPLLISVSNQNIQQLAVHFKPGTLNAILPMFETEWGKINTDKKFQYTKIEDIIRELYSSESNLNLIIFIFTIFTLIIAAFGLFGLSLFIAKSRTREIGIKKVLGSSKKSILYSFLLKNIILVTLATLLSIPITVYLMTKWLMNFAYKPGIQWWIFLFSFIFSLIVVISAVFGQAFRVSRINPIKAIRYE